MKTISILVPETAIAASILDPQYMFSAVNQFFINENKTEPFKIQLVGATKTISLNNGLVNFKVDYLLEDAPKSDLIIIPAISGDIAVAIEKNKQVIDWLSLQYKNGAEMASLCIGAFLLASTGALDQKRCSTHWLYADLFKKMFPTVNLVDDKLITDQNGVYSSGGATSYWNLLLYLVEKYIDKQTAIMATKFFLLDVGKNSQSGFMMFRGQKMHDDCEILRVQDYVEIHFAEKLTVDDLSARFNIGRRTMERRFKKATYNSVIEYIQRVKIEAAKKQLEIGRKNVNEVMYDVGYTDVKAFRDVFKKLTAMTPVEYRNKYNREWI